MTRYEFSLLQEVLMEKGADVLGDLFRYRIRNEISAPSHPVNILYSLIWNAKQDILGAESKEELDRIEGQFSLARRFLSKIEEFEND